MKVTCRSLSSFWPGAVAGGAREVGRELFSHAWQHEGGHAGPSGDISPAERVSALSFPPSRAHSQSHASTAQHTLSQHGAYRNPVLRVAVARELIPEGREDPVRLGSGLLSRKRGLGRRRAWPGVQLPLPDVV